MELDEKNVKKLLDYDAETGIPTWKHRGREWFKRDGDWKSWNKRFPGTLALASTSKTHRYPNGSCFGKTYNAHRVIWLLVFGRWPENQIDHINQDRTDNRIVNLRDVTNECNAKNQKKHRNNTSGYVGVCKHSCGKWQVHITVNSKMKYLGLFENIEDAAAARAAADIKYGFHENHGRESQ